MMDKQVIDKIAARLVSLLQPISREPPPIRHPHPENDRGRLVFACCWSRSMSVILSGSSLRRRRMSRVA